MTREQLAAARQRLEEAAADSDSGLGAGSLVNPDDGSYCAVGALLNGPNGFPTDRLIAWDRIVTERMSVNAAEPQCFSSALPDAAAAHLATVYGLDLDAVELVVNANDGAEASQRLNEVLDQLDKLAAFPV